MSPVQVQREEPEDSAMEEPQLTPGPLRTYGSKI